MYETIIIFSLWPLIKIEIGSDLVTLLSKHNYYLSFEIIGRRITMIIIILSLQWHTILSVH